MSRQFFIALRLLFASIFIICAAPFIITATSIAAQFNLTVIDKTGQVTVFSYEDMVAMPSHTMKTHTPWTDGIQNFTGVLFKDLLTNAGLSENEITASQIVATALNDYEVTIDGSGIIDDGALIAYNMDSQPIPVNTFGPFWIVYPRDDREELQDSRYDHNWAWQLKELQIK